MIQESEPEAHSAPFVQGLAHVFECLGVEPDCENSGNHGRRDVMSPFPRRPGLALTGSFSVRAMLALVTSSAVTAGVAGPLAAQALDVRSNQVGVAAFPDRLGFPLDDQLNRGSMVDVRNPITQTGEAVQSDAVQTNAAAPNAPPPAAPTASDLPEAANVPAEAGASSGRCRRRHKLGRKSGTLRETVPLAEAPRAMAPVLEVQNGSMSRHSARVRACSVFLPTPGRGEVSVSATFAVRPAVGE